MDLSAYPNASPSENTPAGAFPSPSFLTGSEAARNKSVSTTPAPHPRPFFPTTTATGSPATSHWLLDSDRVKRRMVPSTALQSDVVTTINSLDDAIALPVRCPWLAPEAVTPATRTNMREAERMRIGPTTVYLD